MIRNFVTALQFLTVFTISRKHRVEEADLARSMPYFPAIGFMLGVLVVYSDKALEWVFPHTIANAWLIIIYTLSTRALHLDGLADTLDGFMGGKDRGSRLSIMRDSRIGTAGVLGIVFSLLLKYLSLNNLFGDEKAAALLTAPVLGRWSQTLMVFKANYGRERGMGSAFVGHLRFGGLLAAAVIAAGLSAFVGARSAVVVMPAVAAFTLIARRFIVRGIGGVTGDTIGAVSEINEVIVLLLFVVLSSGG